MPARTLLILGFLFAGLALTFLVLPARVGTITVNTLDDAKDGSCSDGDCCLRDAIATASPGDAIQFSVTGTITLENANGVLLIDKSLVVEGPGPEHLTISGDTHKTRIFSVSADGVSIRGTTLLMGKAAAGGAIYAPSNGRLTVENCRFVSNLGTNYGGAIYNFAQLTVIRSAFEGNWTNYTSGGGAIYNGHTLLVIDSTFSGNTTYDSGSGGAIFNAGELIIKNSTFSGNNSGVNGGGIYNGYHKSLTLINCTFSGNSANGFGGGLYNYSGSVTISNSTFSGNQAAAADGGGGIASNEVPVTLLNSIVAGSVSGGNCKGSFAPDSHNNLTTDGTCSPGFIQITNIQLSLGSLTGNPAYFPLNPGSAALDSGLNSCCPPVDQRGAFRPQDGNGDSIPICDVGSYEAGSAQPKYQFIPIITR
jgi:CSLREA domain-containing protein